MPLVSTCGCTALSGAGVLQCGRHVQLIHTSRSAAHSETKGVAPATTSNVFFRKCSTPNRPGSDEPHRLERIDVTFALDDAEHDSPRDL